MKKFPLAAAFWTMCGTAAAEGAPQAAIELYVDSETRQIFAEPGPGRQRLGRFVQAGDAATAPTAPAAARAAGGTVATGTTPAAAGPVAIGTTPASASVPAGPAPAVAGVTAVAAKPASGSSRAWYEKIGIRGYVQMRYNQEVGGGGKDLRSPGDRFIGREQGFGIRRARVVISGDVTDNMSIYIQPDLASTPSGSSTTNFAQLRDAYADLWLTGDKTWRIRAG